MELRKEKRIVGIKNIVLIDEKKKFPVTLTNISTKGLSVMSQFVFPTFKEIEVEMTINEEFFKVSASIRWVNENLGKTKPNFHEIGISLINPPKEYLALLSEL